MTIFEIILLATAAFFAGIVNSIAGGGSFLTFPALVFAGVPTIAANATSSVAVFPGYLSGALGFFKELKEFPLHQLMILLVISLLGGILGSLLLLITPATVFSAVIPWLLGLATLVFALGNHISAWAEKNVNASGYLGNFASLIVCVYGGYFNGGLGIVLLALYSALGMKEINLMNGLKNGMSFIVSAASVTTFTLAGIVFWPQAILMMVAATIGGYCGVIIARRLSVNVFRILVVSIGVFMTILFTIRAM